MQPTFPFLSERTKKQGVEFFFLRLLSYTLTPTLCYVNVKLKARRFPL